MTGSDLHRVLRSVCTLVLRSDFGSFLGVGTGFLVLPGHMLTCHHMLPTSAEARTCRVRCGGDELALDPERLFHTSVDLDCTLVGVDAPSGAMIHALPLQAADDGIREGDAVMLVTAADGDHPPTVARGRVVGTDPNHVFYDVKCREGSSGAPLVDASGGLVALHRGLVPRRDCGGRMLTVHGQPYRGQPVAQEDLQWSSAEGVRASRILADPRFSRRP